MGLREQYGSVGRKSDAGYAMAGLLVAIAVMGIVASMIMPAWRTWAKREKEAELIFRGEQYMRAIELYQRQFAGAYPTDIEMLIDQRFLRKAYTDPMTDDGEFEILGLGSVSAAPGQAQQEGGALGVTEAQPFGNLSRVGQDSGTGSSPTPFSTAAAEANEGAGGIIGVVSSSTDTSMALYNDADRYDEWLFVYLPQSTQPGLGAGVPGQAGQAGQRGGVQPGLGGGRQGRGGSQRPSGAGGSLGAPPRR
jgi:type II secretory pathway pseudopilin PulG